MPTLYRNFRSQQEIDQQYEIERSVADPRQYAELFVKESESARRALDCRLDVRFGPTVEETLDIFPAAAADAPILVFIHGGYWRRLSAKEFSFVARGPVALGMTVVVTNYALCPKVTLTEITRQSRAAVAWLHEAAGGACPGSRERIYVCGHSAGGQQVARLLSTRWGEDYGLPGDVIKGGLSVSGLFDLRPLRFSYLQPMLQLSADIVQSESPLFALPERAPPLIASVGGEESAEFRRQSFEFVEAWNAAGLSGRYHEQPGCNHYTAIEGFADPGSALCKLVESFVEACERVGGKASSPVGRRPAGGRG